MKNEDNFTRKLVSNTLQSTLFDKLKLVGDRLFYSLDFIWEQSSFLNSSDIHNQWLRLKIVKILMELDQVEQGSLKMFVRANLHLVRNSMTFHSNGIERTDQEIRDYLFILIDHIYNHQIVNAILIDCICEKLEDLTSISQEDIDRGYLTKDDFSDLIESYMN